MPEHKEHNTTITSISNATIILYQTFLLLVSPYVALCFAFSVRCHSIKFRPQWSLTSQVQRPSLEHSCERRDTCVIDSHMTIKLQVLKEISSGESKLRFHVLSLICKPFQTPSSLKVHEAKYQPKHYPNTLHLGSRVDLHLPQLSVP